MMAMDTIIEAKHLRASFAWASIPPALLLIFKYMTFGPNYIGRIVDGGFTELLHQA
jgi:hypothetical protein